MFEGDLPGLSDRQTEGLMLEIEAMEARIPLAEKLREQQFERATEHWRRTTLMGRLTVFQEWIRTKTGHHEKPEDYVY